jgi:hypothetical protein
MTSAPEVAVNWKNTVSSPGTTTAPKNIVAGPSVAVSRRQASRTSSAETAGQ